MIRTMLQNDGQRVLEIYEMGLKTRNATFETKVPSWEEWDSKHLSHSRFVFLEEKKVIGWIALSSVSNRKVYQGVAEVSLYVDLEYAGKGIGSLLMEKVIASSEQNGIWTLFSSIFPENISSVRIHEKHGFRKVGIRERIACLDGVWRDTVILERRSKIVGI